MFKKQGWSPAANPAIKAEILNEDLLKEAYKVGRYSPTNSECPPAPEIIPFWIQNNVEILGKYSDRLFDKYLIPHHLEPQLFLSMYKGFRDLILSCPDGIDSPFCLSSKEVIAVSKSIFMTLAKEKGVHLEFD